MASQVGLGQNELLEIDICDADICSEEESGVFVNSGASYTDGFSGFQQWIPSRNSGLSDITNLEKTTSCVSRCTKTPKTAISSCTQVPNGSASPDRGSVGSEPTEDEPRAVSRASIVDCLLIELYDTCTNHNRRSVDSLDSSTEASNSDAFFGRSNSGSNFLQELQEKHTRRRQMKYLAKKDSEELKWIIQEVKYRIGIQSAKLVRQLKRKDRLYNKLQKNCDIVTACLQAVSQKRRVDTRLKFTLEPSLGKNGFQQWYDALKAVARLPTGIPKEWRKRVWLTLADQYLHSISIDWEKTLRFAFNDRSNPDDDSLGIQIVKDLHRTGCSSYCGQEGEQDRVVLKRVLLAYARWNKAVGYCQGFNVLAALILEVTEGNEGDALKVMIYLIDKVLPDSYFANNLRALSVDMAVFRDLLRLKLPELSQHLHNLQKAANREGGGSYEPPLTNVFTMQWFLTMFATCLPHHTVLKIWDSVFFEGSEVLLRVALAIWAKLGERIEYCQSADEFYSTMGCLTQEMLEHDLIDSNELMQTVYSMASFPFPQLAELREKYTYNITPFPAPVKPSSSHGGRGRDSDEEGDMDDEDSLVSALGCLGPIGGLLAPELQRYQKHLKDQREEQSLRCSNIAELSPGAVGAGRAEHQAAINSMMLERMSTDISALKKQYLRIKRRQQQQASLIYIHAGLRATRTPGIPSNPQNQQNHDKCPATSLLASQLHPSPVVNHLLMGKKLKAVQRGCRNGLVHTPGAHGVPLPQAQSSPSQVDAMRSKLNSPWRTHVRTHRRNVARARAQLGYGDTEELIEDGGPAERPGGEPQEEEGKEEEEKEEEEEEETEQEVEEEELEAEERKLEEGEQEEESMEGEDIHPPEQKPQDSGLEEGVGRVQKQLASLDLKPGSEPASLSVKESMPEPDPSVPVLPPPPPPRRKESDSSSSESGGSLRRTPSTPSTPSTPTTPVGPPRPQHTFSPFPIVKPPRKSAAARNLGLYGPTPRTPTVHFPQMSKSVNRAGGGTVSSTRRR
ncbi:TBC1 domain family member 30 isoform X2 [Megalops cyprinoides]|uniref:TBC1 domain family member 30 isoform X2 n=1 Tax=Megalops cyprinoides TaxID=118141 RepID=UPI0018655235|nr:TBC1 domain family member 30 isoform X2 [Megalops cyprinoides]